MKLIQLKESDIKDTVIDHKHRSPEELLKFIQDNCSEAFHATPIYRGLTSGIMNFIVDPSKHIRKSSNTSNHYTYLIDNYIAAWRKYPKRSKSVICTTNVYTAEGYGDVYRVLPFDGAKIGVCDAADFWNSMGMIRNLSLSTMSHFNDAISELFRVISDNKIRDDSAYNIEYGVKLVNDFLEEIKDDPEFDLEAYIEGFRELSYRSNEIERLIKIMIRQKYKSFQDFLDYYLDPTRNGFYVTNIKNFNVTGRREVWTDSKCLLIGNEYYQSIVQE